MGDKATMRPSSFTILVFRAHLVQGLFWTMKEIENAVMFKYPSNSGISLRPFQQVCKKSTLDYKHNMPYLLSKICASMCERFTGRTKTIIPFISLQLRIILLQGLACIVSTYVSAVRLYRLRNNGALSTLVVHPSEYQQARHC